MGTRSYIALQIEEDEYLMIFCHYNGYPDDRLALPKEIWYMFVLPRKR